MRIFRYFLPLITLGLISSSVWAVDEVAIQDLQSDVTVTKDKADKNSQEINSLRGGFPVLEARVAALEGALNDANDKLGQLQAQVDAFAHAFPEVEATANRAAADASAAASAAEAARSAADRAGQAAGAAQSTADQALSAAVEANVRIDELSAVDITELENRVSDVEETLTCVSFDSITMDLIFVGCNVHVRDGLGVTTSTSGLGNLIVGYNADLSGTLVRVGSHNVILGDEQTYTGSGQLLTQFLGSSQDMYVTIGKDLNENISINRNITIGKDSNLNVGLNRIASIGKNLFVDAGQNMNLSGGDMLGVTTGTASIAMQNGGDVSIQGRNISVVGSGRIDVKAAGVLALKGSAITQN
jgi:hypothetical protein